MDRTLIMQWMREAGWSGIYTQWAEPTGKPDWSPVKESLTIPVTVEQIEAFAKLVAEQAMKYGPCYQMGYADGEFAERERLTKLLQEGGK
jgi:hypothetical protein